MLEKGQLTAVPPATSPPADALPADEAYRAYRARRRFGNLDGLRFICIFAVLFHHNANLDNPGAEILGRGFLGVDFFFILSGFLITTLLLREADATGRISMRNFYLRRILRIVPVYFFVVTGISTYYVLIKGRSDLAELVPFYYLFLSNFLTHDIPLLTITWSLSVEEQYYLLCPMVLALMPRKWLVPTCLVLIALNVASKMGLLGIDPVAAGPLLFRLPNATYAPIILGSLVAILLHRPDTFARARAIAGGRYAPVAAAVFLLAFLAFGPVDLVGLPNLLVHCTMAFLLVSLVVHEKTVFTPFLANPVIARVGVVSYGMYLYHHLALDLVSRVTGLPAAQGNLVVLGLYFVLTYLIAEVSFHTLEAYFRRFRPKGSGG